MKSRTIQALFAVIALVSAMPRQATAQPGPPPQDEKARKAQLLSTELFIAIRNNNSSEVSALLSRGADPDSRNWLGFTPLMWSAMISTPEIVDKLLAHHATLEAPSVYGTALSFALVGRKEAVALHLLDKGASIHTQRADAASALMLAAGNGEMAVVQRLLAKKDDPNAKDADGATPLLYAARSGQKEALQALLLAKANVNAQDSHGRTALMAAAENGQAGCVDLLLANKAQVNLQDKEGATALTLASRHNGNAAVVNSLLRGGADASIKDGRGAVALTLAESRGYEAAAEALRKAGASASGPVQAAFPAAKTAPAIERSLSILQSGMKTFSSKVQCGSCHHQGLGMMALGQAQQHGFAVDKALVGSYLQQMGKDGQQMGPLIHQAIHDPNVAKTVPGVDIGDASIALGYMFNGLIAHQIPNNPGLQEVAQFLGTQQMQDGHWGYVMERGQMQSSQFTTTALNLQIQRTYGSQDAPGQNRELYERAKRWLLTTPTPNMEDKSSRLLGLQLAGASKEERAKALQEVLAAQREDGGWAQTPPVGSDAYATGMALYALHVGGELSTEDAAYQRGVQFLLRTQDEDGSWYVNKRANPANIYIDAGFPHGESQYISFAATCWATMALVQGHKQ